MNLHSARERSTWWVLEVLASDPATRNIPVLALGDPKSFRPDLQRLVAERRVRLLSAAFATRELLSILASTLREPRLPA